MENEILKDIPGYEGLYKIDIITGSVIRFYKNGSKHILKKIISRYGYTYFNLCKNGINKKYFSHRLVMLSLEGPCPEGFVVCHNDGNKDNNSYLNLRYGTPSDNQLDSKKHGTMAFINNNPNRGKFGKNNRSSKIVYQYDLEGNLLRKWDSIADITRQIGLKKSSISLCCTGVLKTYKGNKFSFHLISFNQT